MSATYSARPSGPRRPEKWRDGSATISSPRMRARSFQSSSFLCAAGTPFPSSRATTRRASGSGAEPAKIVWMRGGVLFFRRTISHQ